MPKMENRIKTIRIEKSISRSALADITGLHYNKIGDYENNRIPTENITVGNLYKIAQALECKIEDLIIP